MAAFTGSLGKYSLQQMILACHNELGDNMKIVILGYASPHSLAKQMEFDSEGTPMLLNSRLHLFQPEFPKFTTKRANSSGSRHYQRVKGAMIHVDDPFFVL